MALGGLLCRLERFAAVGELLSARWVDHYGASTKFLEHPGGVGDAVAKLFGPAPPAGQQWIMPAWQWLVETVSSWAWLQARYPEWLGAEGEPGAAFGEFDLLACLQTGLTTLDTPVAFWTLEMAGARGLARRLHGDSELRREVAAALGADLSSFDDRAPDVIAGAQGLGMFPRTDEVAELLRSGHG